MGDNTVEQYVCHFNKSADPSLNPPPGQRLYKHTLVSIWALIGKCSIFTRFCFAPSALLVSLKPIALPFRWHLVFDKQEST